MFARCCKDVSSTISTSKQKSVISTNSPSHFWAIPSSRRASPWTKTKWRWCWWPIPHTVKKMQCFLGFANFYRHFIRGFSSIAYPFTSLHRSKPRCLPWNPATEATFKQLKQAVTTAPLLKHPDPTKPFTVEVDASETGIGAILLHRFWDKPELHPVAFFSRKRSSAEQNYDMGNRELLVIKLALDE